MGEPDYMKYDGRKPEPPYDTEAAPSSCTVDSIVGHDCVSCMNWRENPEQCYGCKLNPGYTDNWRSKGSRGFTRDAGKPVNPTCPVPNAEHHARPERT